MLSQVSKLEVLIGERFYQLHCASESPLGELHDALQQMKSYVVQRIVEADKQLSQDKKEESDGSQQQPPQS